MFGFAALVIHTYVFTLSKRALFNATLRVFRTSHTDVNINETSSYVDLAPLYGNNQSDQDRVRKHDGYGLMHNDVFAENRLLLLPPACSVLLVLFCRNHNVSLSPKILLTMSKRREVHSKEALRDQRTWNIRRPFYTHTGAPEGPG